MTNRVLYTPPPQLNARTSIEAGLLNITARISGDGVRILPLGGSNMGKSSYIGTIESAVHGQRRKTAKVRVEGGADHTTLELRDYPITDSISVADLWGWDFNSDNLKSELFKNILEGMIRFGQLKHNPQITNRDMNRVCHAVLFILTLNECFTPGYLEKIKIFHDIAKEMGRVVAFAISKLDLITDDDQVQNFLKEVDPETAENHLLNSSSFKRCSDKIQQVVDGGAVCYPLVNYQNHQNQRVRKLDHLAVTIMEGILIQVENDCLLEDMSSEVFDPFKYETPLVIRN